MSKRDEILSDESSRLEEFFAHSESKTISIEEVVNISQDTDIPLQRVECFALSKGVIPIRYQRNIGTFGVDGQIKLLGCTVMVIGLGGLGGSNEVIGGIWILLVSWAALQSGQLPRVLNYLGVAIGVAGIISVVPALAELFIIIFALGQIVWFIWLGIVMLRSSPSAAA